jgi:hypothetical protein
MYYIKLCSRTKKKFRLYLAHFVNILLFCFSAFSVAFMTYQQISGDDTNTNTDTCPYN